MAAFRKYHWSTSAISSATLSFRDKNFLTNNSGIITVFCAGGVNYPQLQSFTCQRESERRMSEPWDYNKTQSVTFKGAVSQGSHSWTHALPSGDITPRLLPWAPVLPLDKCRPLSWGCWTKWQLCHMSGLQDQRPSVPEARQQQKHNI